MALRARHRPPDLHLLSARAAGEEPRLVATVAAALPGLLAGVHLGGLLFFLEPSLPFAPGPVARALLLYGALGAAGSALLLLPLARLRPARVLRLLPWALTAALAAAALLDSLHASLFAYYLPPGINDRLIKKALWLSGAALVLFYTALLHTLHRRPYGVRSQLAFWLLSLGSVYLLVERRAAFEPPSLPGAAARVEAAPRPALLVVGIDTATLDAVLPMAEQGGLPFFASLLRDGAYGRLGTFAPPREPARWVSLATGKFPFEHGVLGGEVRSAPWLAPEAELRLLPCCLAFDRWGTFGSPARDGAADAERRARALWEILPRLGAPTGVLGWPALDRAASGGGPVFGFEEEFFGEPMDRWRMWPERLAERARIFRVEPEDVAGLGPAAPPTFPGAVEEALAGDLWRQGLARFLLEQGEARSLFLRLPGLAEASRHFFAGYAARRLEGRQSPELEVASARLAAYYGRLDGLLAELWAELEPPRLLMVVSASGAAAPRAEGWPWPTGGEEPVSGVPDGILMIAGDGVRAGTLVTGAELVDVAPTVLYALGAPVARDLEGRVLTEVFTPAFLERHPLTFVPSYEGAEEPPG